MVFLEDLTNLGPHGLLLVDKPIGFTSHTIVAQARRILKTKKIGHSGTLDPFATGLLVLLVGEATSLQSYFTALDKQYQATFKMGEETDTLDLTGKIISKDTSFKFPPHKNIQGIIEKNFLGKITQTPPHYSAIKINGVRAYALSRKNKSFSIPEREVTITKFKLLSVVNQEVEVLITCSSGTYIRSISLDLAKQLGTVGHTKTLKRIKVGSFEVKNTVNLDEDSPEEIKQKIILVDEVINHKNFLKGLKINLTKEDLRLAQNGQFSFLNKQLPDSYFFLSYKNRILMIIRKHLEKIKVHFNLLKHIQLDNI